MSISRVTQASAQTNGSTGITLSGLAAGDLILVFAHRDGSATAPTLATGYTTVVSGGSNTNSERVGYKWSNGSDTTAGTWTNATSVACVVLRGAHFVGAAIDNGGTGTSMTYSALTLQDTGGRSWVVAFGGHRSATNVGATAPTGLTTESSATDVAVFDSEGTKASWSSAAVTVNASSGWRTAVVEVRDQATQSAAAGVPQLIDWRGTAVYENGETVYHIPLTSLSLTGNCVGIAFNVSLGTATLSSVKGSDGTALTDCGNHFTGGTSGQTFYQYIYPNCPSGLAEIKVTFSGATGGFFGAQVVQFYNVAQTSPIDGTATGAEGANPHQPGSITTTAPNSIVWAALFQSGVTHWLGTSIAPGDGFTLLGGDLYNGVAQEYKIQTSAGAVNPAFYLNADSTAGVLAVALKAATAGTAPAAVGSGSAPRVVGIQDTNVGSVSSFTTQFSTYGADMAVVSWAGTSAALNTCKITPSDNHGNTWTVRQTAEFSTSIISDIQIGDTDAAALNSSQGMVFTGTLSHSAGGTTVQLLAVQTGGASPGSYVTGNNNTGNTSGTSWNPVTVTPTGANQLAIVCEDQDGGTVNSGSGGTNFVFTSPYPEGVNGGTFGNGFVNDRLTGYTVSTSTSTITFGATIESPGTSVGNYGAVVAVYKGPVTAYVIGGQGGALAGSLSGVAWSVVVAPSGGGASGPAAGAPSAYAPAPSGGAPAGPAAGATSAYAPPPSGGAPAGPAAGTASAYLSTPKGGTAGGSVGTSLGTATPSGGGASGPAGGGATAYSPTPSGGGADGSTAAAAGAYAPSGQGGAASGPPAAETAAYGPAPGGGTLAGPGADVNTGGGQATTIQGEGGGVAGSQADGQAAYAELGRGGGAAGSQGSSALSDSGQGGTFAGPPADAGGVIHLAGQGGTFGGPGAGLVFAFSPLTGGGAPAGSKATSLLAPAPSGGAGAGSQADAPAAAAYGGTGGALGGPGATVSWAAAPAPSGGASGGSQADVAQTGGNSFVLAGQGGAAAGSQADAFGGYAWAALGGSPAGAGATVIIVTIPPAPTVPDRLDFAFTVGDDLNVGS